MLLDYKSEEIENKLRFENTIRQNGWKINYGVGVEYKIGPTSALVGGLIFSNGGTNILRNIDGIEANHVALRIGLFY